MATAILRPLSLGEILDTSFQVYRRYFRALIPVMFVCYGPTVLLEVFVQASGGVTEHPFLRLAAALMNLVLSAIATAATVFVISEGYLGRSVSGQEALQRSTPYLGRLILASFAFGLLVGLGTLVFIVPGIIIACALSVTWPAIVLEALPTAEAGLRRSWELTKGSRWRIFLLGVVLVLIALVPIVALSTLLGVIAGLAGLATSSGKLDVVTTAITAIVLGVVQLLIYPFFNCVLTILYYDLRVRREGFDLELLATTLQTA
jgi:uncharacterized membrane protein